ncbi:MAG TPA: hypothetical protein VNC59_02765 [Thermoanaerobaculia bacterium]|nr:hypothetical protein [Thermoanaerobaculia bacterium]
MEATWFSWFSVCFAKSIPRNEGRDPGSELVELGPQPRELTPDAAESGFDPIEPDLDPAEPGFDPVEPGLDPAEPGFDPAEPGLDPAEPGFHPVEPGFHPIQPDLDPAQPGFHPIEPTLDSIESFRVCSDTLDDEADVASQPFGDHAEVPLDVLGRFRIHQLLLSRA